MIDRYTLYQSNIPKIWLIERNPPIIGDWASPTNDGRATQCQRPLELGMREGAGHSAGAQPLKWPGIGRTLGIGELPWQTPL
jgi:hypothetical protein